MLEQPKESKIKKWPVFAIFVCLVALTLILSLVCHVASWWVMSLVALDFYLLIILNLISYAKKRPYGWLFAILLALMAVIVVIFCKGWLWWVWLIVILVYIVNLVFYLFSALEEDYFRVYIPLSIFFLIQLVLLNSCSCR